jgi:hypothetical protein
VPLKEATDRAGAALDAGDLEALALALKARRQALQAGDRPTLEAFESGERLLRGLLLLQQKAAFENARLGQIRSYVEFRNS